MKEAEAAEEDPVARLEVLYIVDCYLCLVGVSLLVFVLER